jgi:hypothetical protein
MPISVGISFFISKAWEAGRKAYKPGWDLRPVRRYFLRAGSGKLTKLRDFLFLKVCSICRKWIKLTFGGICNLNKTVFEQTRQPACRKGRKYYFQLQNQTERNGRVIDLR